MLLLKSTVKCEGLDLKRNNDSLFKYHMPDWDDTSKMYPLQPYKFLASAISVSIIASLYQLIRMVKELSTQKQQNLEFSFFFFFFLSLKASVVFTFSL